MKETEVITEQADLIERGDKLIDATYEAKSIWLSQGEAMQICLLSDILEAVRGRNK